MLRQPFRRVPAWACALLGPISAAAALIPARPHVATAVIALVLVVVVLAAALLGGAVVGSVAALDAAFAFDFFATRPYYSVRIDRAEDLETAVLLLVIGVVVGQLVTRSRLDRTAATTARSELERLYRVTELAAGGERPGRIIRVVREELLALPLPPGAPGWIPSRSPHSDVTR